MKQVQISESEWLIMKVLWGEPNLTLKEIVKSVDNDWSYSTVRTLVNRLLKKEMISADKSKANFIYNAVFKEEECQTEEAKNLLNRVFDNSLSGLVSLLVKKESLSEKEFDDLMRIIDKIDKEDNDDLVD